MREEFPEKSYFGRDSLDRRKNIGYVPLVRSQTTEAAVILVS